MQKAADKNDAKNLYSIIKEIARSGNNPNIRSKDKKRPNISHRGGTKCMMSGKFQRNIVEKGNMDQKLKESSYFLYNSTILDENKKIFSPTDRSKCFPSNHVEI